LALTACVDKGRDVASKQSSAAIPSDPVQAGLNLRLQEGRRIFLQHCAACHGPQAQGAPDWRKRDAQGRLPPPPLNGSGHDWHHSLATLKEIILSGSAAEQGNMPAWKGKLSDAQIDAILAWLQSLWPPAVYAAWQEMHAKP
jgi:mono/diheme cytochrome c family protein